MQISLQELQKVARAYRTQQARVVPMEPIPAPHVANAEADAALARELARSLVDTPDIRAERVQAAALRTVRAADVAVAVVRRAIADHTSQE
ncbi:MAG: hypothetical protein P3X24_001815 [bacterium]|nr:hypothetical protein [bacterium]